jgi:hypothetical protein
VLACHLDPRTNKVKNCAGVDYEPGHRYLTLEKGRYSSTVCPPFRGGT